MIKRCRNPIYLAWLAHEQRVLRALADSPLSVPRLLDYAEVDGAAWLVMSRLGGRQLWPEMLTATAQRRAELLRLVGALLRQVHGTPVPASLRSESSWMDRMLAQAERNLGWCDGTPQLLSDLHRRRPAPVPECFIHGDLALDNVLIADGPGEDALSLVDWAGGGPGDPRCDIAFALQTEPEFILSESEVTAFYEGYGRPPVDRDARRWFEDLWEFF